MELLHPLNIFNKRSNPPPTVELLHSLKIPNEGANAPPVELLHSLNRVKKGIWKTRLRRPLQRSQIAKPFSITNKTISIYVGTVILYGKYRGVFCPSNQKAVNVPPKTRRRMARERRGAESSVVSMKTLNYKTIYIYIYKMYVSRQYITSARQ